MSTTSGKKRNNKKRVAVLHGAISNAGDFLIFERGKDLLENTLNTDNTFEFIYKRRVEQLYEKYDGLIILGGPLISRRLHNQSKNIYNYVKWIGSNVPIFCIGLGISGEDFNQNESYFLDEESINFWQYVYKSSGVFSVRDKTTYEVLMQYGIKAILSGCPALFDVNLTNKVVFPKNKKLTKVAMTFPYFSNINIFSPYFLLTIYFILSMRRKFSSNNLGIFFQHPPKTLPMKVIKSLSRILNIKTYDISKRSIASSDILKEYDIYIGTRLHTHIFFLSSGRPSFLFKVDKRTDAFLRTIKTPSNQYSVSGIRKLTDILKEKIYNQSFVEFNDISLKINRYYKIMQTVINKIKEYYESEEK